MIIIMGLITLCQPRSDIAANANNKNPERELVYFYVLFYFLILAYTGSSSHVFCICMELRKNIYDFSSRFMMWKALHASTVNMFI